MLEYPDPKPYSECITLSPSFIIYYCHDFDPKVFNERPEAMHF